MPVDNRAKLPTVFIQLLADELSSVSLALAADNSASKATAKMQILIILHRDVNVLFECS